MWLFCKERTRGQAVTSLASTIPISRARADYREAQKTSCERYNGEERSDGNGEPVPAILFRLVKRRIRCRHRCFERMRFVDFAEADAHRHLEELAAAYGDLGCEDVHADALADRLGLLDAGADQYGSELFSAEAGDDVIPADTAVQHHRKLTQRLIAGRMPVGIVHPLEVVQIEKGDASDRPAPALGEPAPERGLKRPSVEQAGERIG
jgi:hypothetical protein